MDLSLYANEGNEPTPMHCRKGDMECKYWIDDANFDIQEAYFLWDATKEQETNAKDNT